MTEKSLLEGSVEKQREKDLSRAEILLEEAKPNVKLEVFDEPTVVALEEAMGLFEKWEVKEKMAEVYEYWGLYQEDIGNFEVGISYFEKSIAISAHKKASESLAKRYQYIGSCFISLFNFDKAKTYLEEALQICLELFGREHIQIILAQKYFRRLYFKKAEYQKSLEYAYSNLQIAQQLNNLTPLEMADVYDSIATSHIMLGDFSKGEFYLKMALEIYQKYLPPNHNYILTIYHNLSFAYSGIGDFDKAKIYIQKRIDFGEDKNNMNLVYSYHELGNIYHAQKQIDKAIGCAAKALDIIHANNQDFSNIGNIVVRNLAIFYLQNKTFSEALHYLERSLECCIKLFGINHLETGRTNHYFGVYYSWTNDFDKSKYYFQEAENIFTGNPNTRIRDLAQNWEKMAKLFTNFQRYSLAVEYHHKAITHVLGKTDATNVYEYLPLPFKNKRYQINTKYRFFLILLLGKAQSFFNYYWYETKDIKDLYAAYQTYKQVFEFGEQIRKSFQSHQSKIVVIKEMQVEMGGAIRTGYCLFRETQDRQYIQYVFNVFEKNKSYLLLETYQEKNAKQSIALPSVVIQKENDLKNHLIQLEKNIQVQEQKADRANKKLLKQFQDEYFTTYTEFENLKKQLETDYPDYYRQKYSTETVSIASLQSSLQSHQTVLSYFIGEEKNYLFAITSDEYEVFAMEKPDNFTDLIQNYLQSIKFHQKEKFQQLSFELYQILLQEAIDYLIDPFEEEARQVFIIPHAELHYLPFETLIIQSAHSSNSYGELDYLLNHCQISYHYSATLLHLDLQKQPMQAERASGEITFTGFAPVYESSSNAQKQALKSLQSEYAMAVNRSEAVRSDGTWMPLPYSKLEVENIAQLFEEQGLEGKTFLHESATKRNLEEQIGKSRFVLIAAHGIVNDEFPELSGLVLATDGERQTENGGRNTVGNSPSFEFPLRRGQGEVTGDIWNEQRSLMQKVTDDCILNMKEVAMIPMSADLVVLSSCESGIGELHKGEGMMAVNRGFLASGAKNVVSTLFKVNDKASSELTQGMFRYILEGESYVVALQKAKLELLKRKGMSPKMWSGFVMFGAGI